MKLMDQIQSEALDRFEEQVNQEIMTRKPDCPATLKQKQLDSFQDLQKWKGTGLYEDIYEEKLKEQGKKKGKKQTNPKEEAGKREPLFSKSGKTN